MLAAFRSQKISSRELADGVHLNSGCQKFFLRQRSGIASRTSCRTLRFDESRLKLKLRQKKSILSIIHVMRIDLRR